MDPSAAARRSAERWVGVAEKLLMARDLEGCKQFVAQAFADDPRVPGADDLAAAADALLAAQRRCLPSGGPDPYAVLGLDSAAPASRDPDAVHSHYRRLSLLLNRSHPDRPCSLALADAARLVADAWAFLSDPLRKASLDSNLDAIAAASRAPAVPSPEKQQPQPQPPPPPQPASPPPAPQPRQAASATPPSKRGRPPRARGAKTQPPPERQQEAEAKVEAPHAPTFWTACPSCCHLHQFDCSYEALTLLCPSCRQPFFAAAMPTPPPIVPGTDMYYCSWGFFPMGFPGGPAFTAPVNSMTQQPPAALGFYPMGPYLPLPAQGGAVEGNIAASAGIGIGIAAGATAPAPAPEAPMPVKSTHVKVGTRKRGRPKGSKNKNVVIEIN